MPVVSKWDDPTDPANYPPKPVKTRHHLAAAIHPTPARIRHAMSEVDGANAKIAVLITKLVGSMWCAYVFAVIALLGLGPALKPGGEGLIAWIAQTFLQLVLLSVIMVGQAVQSAASDERSEQTFQDTEKILDGLNVKTAGGIADLMTEVQLVGKSVADAHEKLDALPSER
jgi:hypothetical protein